MWPPAYSAGVRTSSNCTESFPMAFSNSSADKFVLLCAEQEIIANIRMQKLLNVA
jgi:hypothetical protein